MEAFTLRGGEPRLERLRLVGVELGGHGTTDVGMVVVAEQAVHPAGCARLLFEKSLDQRRALVAVGRAQVVGPVGDGGLVRPVHQVAGEHQPGVGAGAAKVMHQLLEVAEVSLEIGAHQQAAVIRQPQDPIGWHLGQSTV